LYLLLIEWKSEIIIAWLEQCCRAHVIVKRVIEELKEQEVLWYEDELLYHVLKFY